MSNNYQFNLNPKDPSSEEISKFKDFDGLLDRFQEAAEPEVATTGRIRRLAYRFSAAAAAIALLIVAGTFFWNQQNSLTEKEHFASLPYVNPPLEEVEPTFSSRTVDVNQGGVFEYESGSRLVVPVAAFMDDRGRLVEGEVEIKYREMLDFVDFFLAGIPMSYDSAGTKYLLESAGMVEVYAEKNGQSVNLAPGKSIQVELVSEIILPNIYEVPNYHVYKLDTASRSWVYHTMDNIEILGEEVLDESDPLYPMKKDLVDNLDEIEQKESRELEQIEMSVPKPIEPVRPQKKNNSNPSLELDFLDGNVDATDLQELYAGTVWQISSNSPQYDESDFSEVWESMNLEKVNNFEYELRLISENKEVRLLINPVLTEENYDKAFNQYQQELEAYQQVLAEREAQLKEKKASVKKRYKQERSTAQKAFADRLEALHDQGLQYAATHEIIKRKVINRFTVNGLGIWNCDRLVHPSENTIKAKLVDENGNRFKNQTAYLVDKSRNTVYRFLAGNNTRIQFNENSENLLWLLTDGKKIALYRPEDFKTIRKNDNGHTFVLKTMEQKVESEYDLRKILQF